MDYSNEDDMLYINNKFRKSFQWQLWTYCDNICQFCFLGEENRKYLKDRQRISLAGLESAIDNMDFTQYNNISLIGGEFFQGQLDDDEIKEYFFQIMKKIFQLYVDKKIGSMWITTTLIDKNQTHLYELLDLAESMGVLPKEKYGASGLWLCTSWDATGRFHTDDAKQRWEYNMLNIKQRYPWIKLNTTIILQKSFIELYLNDEFKPKEFMKKFNTSIFYMQPCLSGITEMMLQYESGKLKIENNFDDYWLKLKNDLNKKYDFFPERKQFIKFLTKYHNEDYESFIKLFNINFRSDEIHLNINSEDHDRIISRVKDGSSPEECFPPIMKCGHVYNYAPYIDSNHCCICDRNTIAEI